MLGATLSFSDPVVKEIAREEVTLKAVVVSKKDT
jgi:hypothetical protein